MTYQEFDRYGYTPGWYKGYTELLHLRARWYSVETGTFLSRDPWEGDALQPQSLNGWQYVSGNPINLIDPSGLVPNCQGSKCKLELLSAPSAGVESAGHFAIVHTDIVGKPRSVEAVPRLPDGTIANIDWQVRILDQGNFKDVGNPFYWNPILHPYNADAGIVAAEIKTFFTPQQMDEIRNDSAIEVAIIAEGEEVCDRWQCLEKAMTQIHGNEIGYNLLGPNSSSAAMSVLRFCGLPWIKPVVEISTKRPGRLYPGWGLYLLGELANTRSNRKPIYDDLVDILTSNNFQAYPGQ